MLTRKRCVIWAQYRLESVPPWHRFAWLRGLPSTAPSLAGTCRLNTLSLRSGGGWQGARQQSLKPQPGEALCEDAGQVRRHSVAGHNEVRPPRVPEEERRSTA